MLNPFLKKSPSHSFEVNESVLAHTLMTPISLYYKYKILAIHPSEVGKSVSAHVCWMDSMNPCIQKINKFHLIIPPILENPVLVTFDALPQNQGQGQNVCLVLID